MRKTKWVWAAAVVAAVGVGAGVAAGHGRFGSTPGITDVSASATLTPGTPTTTTCTGADGTYSIQRFSSTGTIASGQLAGTATLALRWVMNTTKNDGYAVGKLVIRSGTTTIALANVEGVLEGSTLSGWAEGRFVSTTKAGSLLGTFEATRSANALAIKFGANNEPGAAVIFGGTGCAATTTTTTTTTTAR